MSKSCLYRIDEQLERLEISIQTAVVPGKPELVELEGEHYEAEPLADFLETLPEVDSLESFWELIKHF